MFTKGQKVICVNDRFHASVCEWGDQLPRHGHTYTVKQVKYCREALTGVLGDGLMLEELINPDDRLAFSTWRFKPYDEEAEIERAAAEAFHQRQAPIHSTQ